MKKTITFEVEEKAKLPESDIPKIYIINFCIKTLKELAPVVPNSEVSNLNLSYLGQSHRNWVKLKNKGGEQIRSQ